MECNARGEADFERAGGQSRRIEDGGLDAARGRIQGRIGWEARRVRQGDGGVILVCKLHKLHPL
jgi:hypothetical protein